jgi:hypothetical protein
MKIYNGCIPCFARQVVEAAEMSTEDPGLRETIIREAMHSLAELPFDKTPPHAGLIIHRIVRNLLGDTDPYHHLKQLYNRRALALYPEMKDIVAGSPDRLLTAARLAIAGNNIDFGIRSNNDHIDLHEVIEETLALPLAIDHSRYFAEAVGTARSILYIADNAGEVVFDRLLIEEIPDHGDRVLFAVHGEPVINDATMEDAEDAGLTGIVRVIDNGSDAPGTMTETCSESFLHELNRADLIISKGQANYETLSDEPGNVYFLLKAKCPVIAAHMNLRVGDLILESLALKRTLLSVDSKS